MADEFNYDVFLSHSVKDKPIVRELAERLRKDGLRVWLDEWVLKPGDHVQAKIEEGLEQSRVLVLYMSANAFGSDWAQLEAGTFRFRDPMNRERRFIPLRLDSAPIKGSLAQFLYINWLPEEREQEYAKLLDICRLQLIQPSKKETSRSRFWFTELVFESVAFSPDGIFALSGSADHRVRVWEVDSGRLILTLEGHNKPVLSVVWSNDGRYAMSGSADKTVRIWEVETGQCISLLSGHTDSVLAVAWSYDGSYALSGSADQTVCVWEIKTGHWKRILKEHLYNVSTVAFGHKNDYALSGSDDGAILKWELDTKNFSYLGKHSDRVYSLACSPDGRYVLSGSADRTVGLWEISTGKCLRVLEGHAASIWSVAWSSDGRYALSGSADRTVRVWEIKTGRCLQILEGNAGSVLGVAWKQGSKTALSGTDRGFWQMWNLPEFPVETTQRPEESHYTNTKVLLVGDSGVGKTGLSNYLALGIKDQERNTSTDGAWATHWPLTHTAYKDGVEREIWLWDFAGQVDYRLVHQLFMDDTAAAVLVFNPQNQNPFEGLGQWDRDMQKAARKPFAKLLAAGRIDCGGLVVSDASIRKFIGERGFRSPLHLTSAKTGEGCDELRDAIIAAIDWQSIPETTSPALYHRMKQEILHLRDSGLVLIRLAELKQRMEMALLGERFELAELQTVVGLLAGPGMIQRVDFGGFILLRPEVISRYAAAVVRRVRKHPQELGCIREDELLGGELDYQDFERLPLDDEKVILRALLETFVSRAWCLRQPCDGSALLTFPSYTLNGHRLSFFESLEIQC